MEPTLLTPKRPSALASAWQRWRNRAKGNPGLKDLPCIPVAADDFETLTGPTAFRERLLALIADARQRIFIAALYVQDDDAGREVLAALYPAKKAHPQLEIGVFVKWHRAQRGLIGKTRSPGNAALYKSMAQRFGPGVAIYGVPIQRRELMGVLHLKGLIIDDRVLYTGASINDVYLQRHERYRLDRYHLIRSKGLADSMAGLLSQTFRDDPAVHLLDNGKIPTTASIRNAIIKFRRLLSKTRYLFTEQSIKPGEVGITPLLGVGARGNELNAVLLQLILHSKHRLILFTPYFNLPGLLRKAVDKKLKAGCQITIVLGDKTANDFYLPPDEPFKTIGALPYLYEANLRRFCKTHQKAIDSGQLNVHLWRHDDNTFHLKGLLVDENYALLTGNNLNPRAWRLDLENGLLIHDPQKLLLPQHMRELEQLLEHAPRLHHHQSLDAIETYPLPVQRLIKRLSRVRADRLVNQVL
ncbi:MAG: CDP-diacylglycerol--serine O-phosphatidyltransferase [Betaproteobacteria bacterium]